MLGMRRLLAIVLVWVVALSTVAAAYGSFDPREYPSTLTGKHVKVFFTTSGPNEVKKEYAEQVLALAEEAYDRLVTKGGLRPPRLLPVPIVLQYGEESVGGSVTHSDYGHDLWVQINPSMARNQALGDVVAHELFHVIQASYQKHASRPLWALEGTAPVAVAYAYERTSGRLKEAMQGHLSLYWSAHDQGMKETVYMSSLFWYWLAEKYGGLDFMGRVLQWSEDVPWERAAQLAAIQGGAPDTTTFDRLWRSFVLAMVDGQMPEGYRTVSWFRPTRVNWNGSAQELSNRDKTIGTTSLGSSYSFFKPLVLAPYSFVLVEVVHQSGDPLELTVVGDATALEAYVIRPGPNLLAAMRAGRESVHEAVAPPTDPKTLGAPIKIGAPVRIDGEARDRTMVLVTRLGNWGHGQFSVGFRTPRPESGLPVWTSLRDLPHGQNTAGSPPALTATELTALRAGTYLKGTSPLLVESLSQSDTRHVVVDVGSATAWNGREEVALPVPVTVDAAGKVWFPARSLSRLLGATIEGNRFTFGDTYIEIAANNSRLDTAKGYAILEQVPRREKDELMVGFEFFSFAGCRITLTGTTYSFTYPHPDKE